MGAIRNKGDQVLQVMLGGWGCITCIIVGALKGENEESRQHGPKLGQHVSPPWSKRVNVADEATDVDVDQAVDRRCRYRYRSGQGPTGLKVGQQRTEMADIAQHIGDGEHGTTYALFLPPPPFTPSTLFPPARWA